MRRIVEFIDWAARLHFIGTAAWALGGWIVTFFGLSAAGWDPGAMWLGSVVVAACCALIFIAIRTRGVRPGHVAHAVLEGAAVTQPKPDISARDAYFQTLDNSEWKKEQLSTTTDTKHLRPDWLEFRLRGEIHKALRNDRLASWGEECLHGMVTTPEKPIPPDAWDKIELVFDSNPSLVRTAAHFKGRTTYEKGPTAWLGVKLSKDQFFKIFPPSTPQEISLFDAASRAYGESRGTSMAETAEQDAANPLLWYAHYFIRISNTPIYGNLRFSPKRELINPS